MRNDLRLFFLGRRFFDGQPVSRASDSLIQPGNLLIKIQLLIQNIQLGSNGQSGFRDVGGVAFLSLFWLFCFFDFFRPFRFLSSFRGFFPNSGFLFGFFGKRRFYLRRFFFFIDCGGLGGCGRFQFHPFLCPFFAAYGVAALPPIHDGFRIPVNAAASQQAVLNILQKEAIVAKGMQRFHVDGSGFLLHHGPIKNFILLENHLGGQRASRVLTRLQHLKAAVLGKFAYDVGINGQLIAFPRFRRIISILPYLNKLLRAVIHQMNGAKTADVAHPFFERALFSFVGNDPQASLVRKILCGVMKSNAFSGTQRDDTKNNPLFIIFLYICKCYCTVDVLHRPKNPSLHRNVSKFEI